jgi:hypothetical protein
MDAKEFWATKSPLPEFHSVTFAHPSFDGPVRLVANQFAPVTLGGFEHQPCPMTIRPPDQSRDGQPKLNLAFVREVVGREFKRKLRLVTASGSRDPIAVTYAVYLGDTAAPAITWELFASEAGGVTFTSDSVQVTCTDDNPMRRAVAPIYTPDVFTGLAIV